MSEKTFRVALVRAFSQSEYKEPAEPLGIEAIAAALRGHGIECKLFDREMLSLDEAAETVVEYQPSLLGLSILMEDNAADALRLLLKVRSRLPVPCVVGGMYITTSYENARALFPGDCKLVVGEGETALLRICSELTGDVYPGMDRPYLPPEEWPRLYRPNLQDYLNIGAPINMKTSRGCPGRCKFCATPFLPNGLSKWSGRGIPNVVDEMQDLCAQYYPHAFNFVDDDFGPISRLEQLVDELSDRDMRCALSLQLRANAVYRTPNLEQVMHKLKKGGLCRVFIGIESFDEQVLSYFDKKIDPIKALEAFKTMIKCGIAVHIGYILWHPMSTLDSVRAEAGMLRDLGFFTTKIVMAKLQMFPGCGLQLEKGQAKLRMPLDYYYEAVKEKIAPLYDAWLVGALDVPRQYCLAYLEPEGEAPKRVVMIEELLERLDALAYEALLDCDSVSDAVIRETAEDVKKRLHGIGCTFDRPR